MQHQRNARFWAYVNDGFVKLTLTVARPSIEISTGGRHEEGWSRDYECWELSEQGVDRLHMSDGVDCDGRTSSTWRTFCAFDRLASFAPFDPADPMLPDWQEIKSWQRDYSAEAAGY